MKVGKYRLIVGDALKRESKNEAELGKQRGEDGKSRDSAVTLTPTLVVVNDGLTGGLVGQFLAGGRS